MALRAEIFRDYRFDAAHQLLKVPEGHKCRRLHGHTWRVRVALEAEVGAESGWVADYAELDELVQPLIDQLDHRYLNDIVSNPTCEMVAVWLVERLGGWPGRGRLRVTVQETPDSGATVEASW